MKTYTTNGYGIAIKTESGSAYVLEQLENGEISSDFLFKVPFVNPATDKLYLLTQTESVSGKFTLTHPVIAVSLKSNFSPGNTLDLVIAEDVESGDDKVYRFGRINSSDISESEAVRYQQRTVSVREYTAAEQIFLSDDLTSGLASQGHTSILSVEQK